MRRPSPLPILAAALAIVAPSLAACPASDGPSARAVDEYLARHGVAPTGDVPTPAEPAAAPLAERVSLTVVSAAGLPDTDDGPGVTDPYVVVEYDGQRFETGVVEGSQEPKWGDSFVFDARSGGILTVSLMDEDAFASDDKLGVVSQTIAPLHIGESRDLELAFRNGEGGTLKLTLTGMARP